MRGLALASRALEDLADEDKAVRQAFVDGTLYSSMVAAQEQKRKVKPPPSTLLRSLVPD